jgi:MHS family proline/betaine transporter-like MFS transporter
VQSNYIIAIALLIGTPLFIVFGRWSDKVGRKYIMMAGLILAVIAYRPIYKTMYALADVTTKTEISSKEATNTSHEELITIKKEYSDGSFLTENINTAGIASGRQITLGSSSYWYMILLVALQVIFVTMVYGPIAAFLVELFPTRIRYTSMSLPYHIGNGIFGGLTPFIATSLYEFSKTDAIPSGDPFAGLWYPIGVAAVCFVIGMIFLSNKVKGEVLDDIT